MKLKSLVAASAVLAAFVSCKSYVSVPYFQDLNDLENLPVLSVNPSVIRVASGDRLNIVVSSGLTPEIGMMYNLPLQSQRIGAVGAASNSSYNTMPYIVDKNGDIDFPVLGKLRVAGMTREEIAETVKNLLVSNQLLKDAVVTCEVTNHYVNILGDVRTPGRIQIEKDAMTIVEALARCGDLNITGERQDVVVIRKDGNNQKVYRLDLTSAEDVYGSEAFFLQPDDVVYVNPNDTKQRTARPEGNSWQTPAIYVSLTSILLTVTNLIISITRK